MKKWRKFETSSYEIIQKLNPKAKVHNNIYIVGKLSRKRRQVDIKLVEPEQYDFIAFECKDHGRPLDIPVIEAFNLN